MAATRASDIGDVGDIRVDATMRVIAGEPLGAVADDLGVSRSDVTAWRDAFVAAGRAAVGAPKRPVDDRRERSVRTREHLLTTAVECLAELGYANASTNVIAKRAGLS